MLNYEAKLIILVNSWALEWLLLILHFNYSSKCFLCDNFRAFGACDSSHVTSIFSTYSDVNITLTESTVPRVTDTSNSKGNKSSLVRQEGNAELFVPGTLYILKRNANARREGNSAECFSLWKRHSGEHFQRIRLSNNIISDHKCDSHYYALRDVLKGLPGSTDEAIFRWINWE